METFYDKHYLEIAKKIYIYECHIKEGIFDVLPQCDDQNIGDLICKQIKSLQQSLLQSSYKDESDNENDLYIVYETGDFIFVLLSAKGNTGLLGKNIDKNIKNKFTTVEIHANNTVPELHVGDELYYGLKKKNTNSPHMVKGKEKNLHKMTKKEINNSVVQNNIVVYQTELFYYIIDENKNDLDEYKTMAVTENKIKTVQSAPPDMGIIYFAGNFYYGILKGDNNPMKMNNIIMDKNKFLIIEKNKSTIDSIFIDDNIKHQCRFYVSEEPEYVTQQQKKYNNTIAQCATDVMNKTDIDKKTPAAYNENRICIDHAVMTALTSFSTVLCFANDKYLFPVYTYTDPNNDGEKEKVQKILQNLSPTSNNNEAYTGCDAGGISINGAIVSIPNKKGIKGYPYMVQYGTMIKSDLMKDDNSHIYQIGTLSEGYIFGVLKPNVEKLTHNDSVQEVLYQCTLSGEILLQLVEDLKVAPSLVEEKKKQKKPITYHKYLKYKKKYLELSNKLKR